MNFKKYYNACQYLESLGKLDSPLEYLRDRKIKDLKKYLFRMQDLLDRMGNPERDMKYIHITGTAGKGTIVSLLHNIFSEAGYMVGSTSSPAITSTIERIKVGQYYIDPIIFAEIVESLKPVITDMYLQGVYGKPSYFDCMLAIALVYFKQQKCDVVILEVGMGGRYDATNIIPDPLATVITNIDYDHTHLLGNELEAIAHEKAGIIKNGSLFFTNEQKLEITTIFKKICNQVGAKYVPIISKDNSNDELATIIAGRFDIGPEEIKKGIENTKLPCRFEIMQNNPTIILDGAHSVSKVIFSLKKLETIEYKNLHVIFGCGHTKDGLGMIDEIIKYSTSITLVPVINSIGKSFSLKKMQQHINENYPGISIDISFESKQALQNIQTKINDNDAVLIIGSLYITGDLRKQWYKEQFILEKRRSF